MSLTVGPAQGDLLLHTGVEGRAARLGHRLTLAFTDWQCTAEVVDDVPTEVVLDIAMSSLEVRRGEGGLTPLGPLEKRQVRSNALKTLDAKRYPGARWSSTGATETGAGFLLEGMLDLHGQQHPCPVRLDVAGGRAHGTAEVLQTAWGVTPYSQALGSLRVTDAVAVTVTAQL